MTGQSSEDKLYLNLFNYYEKYRDQTIVIKFGGALASDHDAVASIAKQAIFIRHNMDATVVIVHGGGVQIDKELARRGIDPNKDPVTGLRITDAPTLSATDAALRALNGDIVRIFNNITNKVKAFGLAGYDASLIKALPHDPSRGEYTGYSANVDVEGITHFINNPQIDLIPIFYSVCENAEPKSNETRLNVNADDVASRVASDMKARRLILCGDVKGVSDKEGNLISDIEADQVDTLIENGTVVGGMKEKMRSAAEAAKKLPHGGVALVDGYSQTAVLKEMLSEEGSGTLIRKPGRRPPPAFQV